MSTSPEKTDHITAIVASLPPFSTRKETASLFRTKEQTISRWVESGIITAIQPSQGTRGKQGGRGAQLLFARGEIERRLREWNR